MKIILGIIVCLFISGCATYKYNFDLITPKPTGQMQYNDDKIQIEFEIKAHPEPNHPYVIFYNNIGFKLSNKTDQLILVDWNKVSFRDYKGISGNPVMHGNIKFGRCTLSKLPSVVPAHGTIEDVIVPCYAENGMLPRPQEMPDVDLGFFMPLSIGNETVNYNFEFHGHICQERKGACLSAPVTFDR